MKLQNKITNSLLCLGLSGFLSCDCEKNTQEENKITRAYVAEFPMYSRSGAGVTAGVAVGDMNGDGRLDIIVAARDDAGGRVYVLLNNGDGTYSLSEK